MAASKGHRRLDAIEFRAADDADDGVDYATMIHGKLDAIAVRLEPNDQALDVAQAQADVEAAERDLAAVRAKARALVAGEGYPTHATTEHHRRAHRVSVVDDLRAATVRVDLLRELRDHAAGQQPAE